MEVKKEKMNGRRLRRERVMEEEEDEAKERVRRGERGGGWM